VITSELFDLCLGEICDWGHLIDGCDAKDSEKEGELMRQYCISKLGVGSWYIAITENLYGGGGCGALRIKFRCENTVMK
jgi:hypothetical protein